MLAHFPATQPAVARLFLISGGLQHGPRCFRLQDHPISDGEAHSRKHSEHEEEAEVYTDEGPVRQAFKQFLVYLGGCLAVSKIR